MGIVDKLFKNFKALVSAGGFPWAITGLTLLVVLLYEIFLPTWGGETARLSQVVFWLFVLAGAALIFQTSRRMTALSGERERLGHQLKDAEKRVAVADAVIFDTGCGQLHGNLYFGKAIDNRAQE